MKKIFITFSLLIILLIGGLSFGWYFVQNYLNTAIHPTKELIFTLPSGTNSYQLTILLEKEGIITGSQHNKLLPWIIRFDPQFKGIKAGTYQIKPRMTLQEILRLFVSGKEAQFSIKFIEGKQLSEWMNVIEKNPYIKQTIIDKSEEGVAKLLNIEGKVYAEGWLYPDTYNYIANTTDVDILKRTYQKMQKELQQAWQQRDENLPYKTPYEMLIMASIIEKETSVQDERALVASVFVNRLKIGMRLQTDPTVIYGIKERYDGNIRRKDLQEKTDYNTYVIDGLPPTPIAMPGKASLQAAAKPAKSKYLYFVANGTGKHTFSTNLDDHNKAVQEYLKYLRSTKQ